MPILLFYSLFSKNTIHLPNAKYQWQLSLPQAFLRRGVGIKGDYLYDLTCNIIHLYLYGKRMRCPCRNNMQYVMGWIGINYQFSIFHCQLFNADTVIRENCNQIQVFIHDKRIQKITVYHIDVGQRRVDFLIENEISVEIKAIVSLENVHFAQAINYLEAYNLQTDLLINFGAKSLQFKRLFNKKYKF